MSFFGRREVVTYVFPVMFVYFNYLFSCLLCLVNIKTIINISKISEFNVPIIFPAKLRRISINTFLNHQISNSLCSTTHNCAACIKSEVTLDVLTLKQKPF